MKALPGPGKMLVLQLRSNLVPSSDMDVWWLFFMVNLTASGINENPNNWAHLSGIFFIN